MINHRKGFTFVELLIVLAIIAITSAMAIPIFTKQLEKSRETVDATNTRTQYTEVLSEAIMNEADVNVDGSEFGKIDLIQKEESQLFQFWVIVLCVNCGVINLIVMKNKYTLFEKIIMVNQIKTNIDEFVKGNYNILKSTIQYDIINNKIIFNTKNEK